MFQYVTRLIYSNHLFLHWQHLDSFLVYIAGNQRISRLQKIFCHSIAHNAQADQSYFVILSHLSSSHPLFFFYKYLRQVCLFVILADHLHAARLLDHYVYRGEDRALSFYDMSAKYHAVFVAHSAVEMKFCNPFIRLGDNSSA